MVVAIPRLRSPSGVGSDCGAEPISLRSGNLTGNFSKSGRIWRRLQAVRALLRPETKALQPDSLICADQGNFSPRTGKSGADQGIRASSKAPYKAVGPRRH